MRDEGGNTFLLSTSWITMRNTGDAERLTALADTYGTGNVTPLPSELFGYRGVRYDGKHYGSSRDGSQVVIAEAAPVGGHPDDAFLKAIAEVAAEAPAP